MVDIKLMLQIFEIVLVLLLSTVIVASIPKFRELVNSKAKIFLYLVLGLILFSLVGMGYNVIQDMHSTSTDAISILYPYTQFYPLFILSIGLAGVVLITYMDGELYGYIFAGTGFAVLLPDVLKYSSNGRYDLLLLGIALWAIIPVIWVFFFKDQAQESPSIRERAWSAIKASLFSYPVYAATAAVATFGETYRMISSELVASVTQNSSQIAIFILMSLWFYLLLTVIIVSIMFVMHDLLMHVFNVRRTVTDKGVKYEVVHPVAEIITQEEPKIDAYKSLIEEVEVFYKYMDRVDRLRAASTIARFKNEYNTLAARHDEGSKAEAERLIKLVDQEFKKRY